MLKRIQLTFRPTILFIATLFAIPAQGDVFIGAKVGRMMVDTPLGNDPTNTAVILGYEIDSMLADFSLVGEINRTMSSGKTNQRDELEFGSEAIYLHWKTTRALFVTLRAGVVQNEIIIGSTLSRSDGILIGGSVGIVMGRTRLQIEYTSYAGDANFLSLGLEF